MSFVNKASAYFPNVDWHGQSQIHVSVCWDSDMPYTKKEAPIILTRLEKKKVAEGIWGSLQDRFGSMEWLITGEGFKNLFFVDISRHLKGVGDSPSAHKLKNPETGNRFHRIALIGNLVGGVRFWAKGTDSSHVHVGYRFRIEKQNENEEKTRDRAMREQEEIKQEAIEIMAELDLKEPSKEKAEEQFENNV